MIQLTASDGSSVDCSRAWSDSLNVPFFRFSPSLRKTVDLNETRELQLIDMLWDTEYYMVTKCADEITELVDYLNKLPLTNIPAPQKAASPFMSNTIYN